MLRGPRRSSRLSFWTLRGGLPGVARRARRAGHRVRWPRSSAGHHVGDDWPARTFRPRWADVARSK
eukprot:4963353-Lingulodinium_polyedra.AAC.1